MMHSNSTVNLINKPTWFPRGRQRGAPSLLDHFYTNQTAKVTNIGLLVNDISDHLPIVATISMQTKKFNKTCHLISVISEILMSSILTNLWVNSMILKL